MSPAILHLISGVMMEMPGDENDGNWRQYWVSWCDRMCWWWWWRGDVTPQFVNLENI